MRSNKRYTYLYINVHIYTFYLLYVRLFFFTYLFVYIFKYVHCFDVHYVFCCDSKFILVNHHHHRHHYEVKNWCCTCWRLCMYMCKHTCKSTRFISCIFNLPFVYALIHKFIFTCIGQKLMAHSYWRWIICIFLYECTYLYISS